MEKAKAETPKREAGIFRALLNPTNLASMVQLKRVDWKVSWDRKRGKKKSYMLILKFVLIFVVFHINHNTLLL